MNFRNWVVTGLLSATLTMSAAVHAQDAAGLYIGASIGEATDEADGFKDSGTSFKVMGGYSFNRFLAAELAYVDAGKLQDRVDDLDVTVESKGVVAAVLGKLPIGNRLSLFAKLGYTFYDEEVSVRLGSQRVSEKNSSDDALYGIGAEVNFNDKFKLRAEYEIVDISNADFSIMSIGGTYQF